MNIRFLETVLWLERLRTVKATAEKLCLTDAAVSSRIAAIEQDLGVRLFVKGEKGFLPTRQGTEFIKAAEGIVNAYYELRQKLLDPAELRGNVRIGVVATIGMTIFPYIVQTLKDKFPQVSLTIVTDLSQRLYDGLGSGDLDICLCAEPANVPRQIQRAHIYSVGNEFIASPKLRIATDVPLTPDTLCRHPVIGYPRGIDSQSLVDEYFRDVEASKLNFHASNSVYTTINMVAAGLGIAAVPAVLVRKEIDAGSLVILPLKRPLPDSSFSALYSSDAPTGVPMAIAAIAREGARLYCDQFDANLARQTD
jgi:DNA-binding transcriptional LysR family regulator